MKRTVYANCNYDIVDTRIPTPDGPIDAKIFRLVPREDEVIDFPLAPQDVEKIVEMLQTKPEQTPAESSGFQVVQSMPDVLRRRPRR